MEQTPDGARIYTLRQAVREAPTELDAAASTPILGEVLALLNTTLARAVGEDMRVLHVSGLFHSGYLRLVFKGVGLDTPNEVAERYLKECLPHP